MDDLEHPQEPERDPEREREKAIKLAYRSAGHRERTEAELRTFLERRKIGPDAIEDAVAELVEAGLLDDASYARRFAEDRRSLDHWGSDRIARDLQRRGIAADLIEAAVADRSREAELDSAVQLLAMRMPAPGDDRERNRAWQLLVRRGYEPELAYEAVRRHERGDRARHAA